MMEEPQEGKGRKESECSAQLYTPSLVGFPSTLVSDQQHKSISVYVFENEIPATQISLAPVLLTNPYLRINKSSPTPTHVPHLHQILVILPG